MPLPKWNRYSLPCQCSLNTLGYNNIQHLTIDVEARTQFFVSFMSPVLCNDARNRPAICGYMVKWWILSAVLCSQDQGVCDLFPEASVKQRLPLVILTSSQSNQSEWWWGGHMLISIRSVEQRTLLLSSLVIPLSAYVFVLLCGISI